MMRVRMDLRTRCTVLGEEGSEQEEEVGGKDREEEVGRWDCEEESRASLGHGWGGGQQQGCGGRQQGWGGLQQGWG